MYKFVDTKHDAEFRNVTGVQSAKDGVETTQQRN
jgi:hypothetical protein